MPLAEKSAVPFLLPEHPRFQRRFLPLPLQKQQERAAVATVYGSCNTTSLLGRKKE